MGNGESSSAPSSPRQHQQNGHSSSQQQSASNGHSISYSGSTKRHTFANIASDFVDISAMETLTKEEMEGRFLEIVVRLCVVNMY